jgi:hypothetical protein
LTFRPGTGTEVDDGREGGEREGGGGEAGGVSIAKLEGEVNADLDCATPRWVRGERGRRWGIVLAILHRLFRLGIMLRLSVTGRGGYGGKERGRQEVQRGALGESEPLLLRTAKRNSMHHSKLDIRYTQTLLRRHKEDPRLTLDQVDSLSDLQSLLECQ